jgi:hypothetical protein
MTASRRRETTSHFYIVQDRVPSDIPTTSLNDLVPRHRREVRHDIAGVSTASSFRHQRSRSSQRHRLLGGEHLTFEKHFRELYPGPPLKAEGGHGEEKEGREGRGGKEGRREKGMVPPRFNLVPPVFLGLATALGGEGTFPGMNFL